jgi:lysophospholipase L1-like esterase
MQQRHIVTALACFVLIAAPPAQAQDEELPPVWPGFIAPAKEHVARRLPQIQALAPLQEGVLFIGDSITEGAPLWAMFPGLPSANYGIGWDTTDGLLLRLDQVRRNVAERAFILIGTNDLGYQHSARHIASNIQSIVAELLPDMPGTEFYVISILPRDPQFIAILAEANKLLRDEAEDGNYVFLDLASRMMAADGSLREELTYDSLHLNVHGYAVWARALDRCVRHGCTSLDATDD